jgi:CHRD domain
MNKLARLVLAATALTAAAPASAMAIFTANLTNDQENLIVNGQRVPVVPTFTTGELRPVSFGSAVLVLNDAMTALTYSIEVFNIDFTGSQTADINDNLNIAHIHGSATLTPTTNAPVVFGFIGTPFNETAPNDVVVTPFTDAVGGMVTGKWDAPEGNNTTLTAQLANLFAGRTYLNFHTQQFPGGEIRGAIRVPEPPAWALMALGFGALAWSLRRRSSRRLPLPA